MQRFSSGCFIVMAMGKILWHIRQETRMVMMEVKGLLRMAMAFCSSRTCSKVSGVMGSGQ